MIRLVAGAGRRKRQKKKEKERRRGPSVYRYRDGDLLSCIPLLGATCAARGGVERGAYTRWKKKRAISVLLTCDRPPII